MTGRRARSVRAEVNDSRVSAARAAVKVTNAALVAFREEMERHGVPAGPRFREQTRRLRNILRAEILNKIIAERKNAGPA